MPKVVTIAPMGGQPGANCLRVPKLRVCDERLGKRGGPVDGSRPGGAAP